MLKREVPGLLYSILDWGMKKEKIWFTGQAEGVEFSQSAGISSRLIYVIREAYEQNFDDITFQFYNNFQPK